MFWGKQTKFADLKRNVLAPNKTVKPKQMLFFPFFKISDRIEK